jgi:hypothetical protein
VRPLDLQYAPASQPYPLVRGRFVEGDLLGFRGRGPVSWTIRRLTRSRYSHVGLVHLFEQRVYCLEAVGSGVRLCLMSELVRRYPGGIDYFEILGASEAQRRGAVGFGFQQLGRRFDFGGLSRFFVLLVFGRRRRARADTRWFCAELVAEAYRRQGVTLCPGSSCYASPSLLTANDAVRLRFRVKR